MSACFRLRHGDGRYAPASSDLRLHSTFTFAEPQAEAKKIHSQKNSLIEPDRIFSIADIAWT